MCLIIMYSDKRPKSGSIVLSCVVMFCHPRTATFILLVFIECISSLSISKGQESRHRMHKTHQGQAFKDNRYIQRNSLHVVSDLGKSLPSSDKADEILSIKNNTIFLKKVIQLMKADDSDVLKKVNEDEEPFFWQRSEHPRSSLQESFYRVSNASDIDHVRDAFKRSGMHSLAYNSTLPDVTSSFPSIAFDSMLAESIASNASKQPGDQIAYGSRILKASRVCKPGPPLASNKRLPNCLIIGDSIALSYSYSVAAALQGRCVVQIAPFSKSGVGLDSRYALQCLRHFLSTSNLTPTRFDVIVFNFGLHDIDLLDRFPEEFNDEKKYARNLGRIKKKLLRTGAAVVFALTTPVTYDKEKDEMVVKYNAIAKRVMSKGQSIDTINLYKCVVDQCGKPPFKNCFMMKKPNDVHFGVAGTILLGKQVASKMAQMLKDRKLWVEKGFGLPEDTNFTTPLFDMKKESIKCSSNATVPTRCPSRSTCVPNLISRTGYGCCMLQNGVDCGDNWHCCPENTNCHKNCSPVWCKCIMK